MRGHVVLLVAALLLGLVPPSAAEVNPLSVFIWETPLGAGVNDTITIHVDSYMWASPADLDNLSITVHIYQGPDELLDFERVSEGSYLANWTIPERNYPESALFVTVGAIKDGYTATPYSNYFVDGPSYPTGLLITTSVANQDEIGYDPRPGDAVVFEARTYFDGRLDSRGIPDSYVVPCGPRGGCGALERLWGEEAGVGIFRYHYQIPTNVSNSTKFEFHALLPDYVDARYGAAGLYVHPVSAVLHLENFTDDGADARVCAALEEAPLENATVAFEAIFHHAVPNGSAQDLFVNLSTGANGCAIAPFKTPGYPGVVSVRATVAAFGLTTRLGPENSPGSLHFQQDPSYGPNGTFLLVPRDENVTYPRGEESTFEFIATMNGIPMANVSLGVLASYGEVWPPGFVGTLVTDSEGGFSFPFTVPEGGSPFDGAAVSAIAPSGERAEAYVLPGPYPDAFNWYPKDANLTIGASQLGNGSLLRIRAPYTGPENASALIAWASLTPLANQVPLNLATDGNLPFVQMTWDGEAFVADLQLPGWRWDGEYVLSIMANSWGAGEMLDNSIMIYNWTTVHLSASSTAPVHGFDPAPPPPVVTPPATPPPTPLAPSTPIRVGADWAWLLVLAALIAAVAAVAWRTVVLRKRE